MGTSVRPVPSDRAPSDWSGTQRYEIVRYLGRGSMGVVYEARDRESGQSVALKTLLNATPAALCSDACARFPPSRARLNAAWALID